MRYYKCKRAKYEEPVDYFKILADKRILEEIFRRLESRRALALVNKLCYETVCKIDNSEDLYRARFDQENIILENGRIKENIYPSILHSQRVVTEIIFHQMYFVDFVGEIYTENYQSSLNVLAQTLQKLSASIKKLTIYSCLLTENQLMFILNFLLDSKLEELNIVECAIIHENSKKISGNLKFPLLKKLDMNGTNYGSLSLNYESNLRNGVMFDFLGSISENSTKLCSLSVKVMLAQWMSINNFRLTDLCIQKANPSNIRLSSIICEQTNLTEVDFLDCFVMEDVINEILQLKSLKCLRINLEGITIKGLTNICNKQTLEELGLKCSKAPWIVNGIIMANMNFLKKLYLDIKDVNLTQSSLSCMLNKKIPKLHVVASQNFVLDSIFLLPSSSFLKTCTVDVNVEKIKTKKFTARAKPSNLTEFTFINRNEQATHKMFDLNVMLERCSFLEKIRIEGFDITGDLFEAAIKNHIHLKELYLLSPKNRPNDFVFDKSYADIIQTYGRRLKIMEISCTKSKLKSAKQFPYIIRRQGVKIFRIR